MRSSLQSLLLPEVLCLSYKSATYAKKKLVDRRKPVRIREVGLVGWWRLQLALPDDPDRTAQRYPPDVSEWVDFRPFDRRDKTLSFADSDVLGGRE